MSKKRGFGKMGGIKKIAVSAGLGVAVGLGLAAVTSKLPIVNAWSPYIGIAGAYFSAGVPGAIGYALASGALGSLNLSGGAASTGTYLG